ncbi:hypothetical protein JTE90_027780 [Oedothorax gibbosus]|uniref:Histone H2A n=1 Tax=Oedothorax gibbosus TaxID=931172 RepID=A0AAV6V609_9ARAC|nr:hypothetical protein JTE90_027780 [Oedothorax gibbosus]
MSNSRATPDIAINIQAVHDVLKEKYKGPVNPSASVYLAAVLQSIAVELIEAGGRKGADSDGNAPSTITKTMIQQAIEGDEELDRVFTTGY